MRPYLAVIADSFHEALVSRVLWILLGATTVFLLALLPLGVIEQAGGYLREDDILNPGQLVAKIVAQSKSEEPTVGGRIWALLDDPTRRSLDAKVDADAPGPARPLSLARTLQGVIANREFYQADNWGKVRLPAQARALLAKGLDNLPDDQVARFNRLALEAAFPAEIVAAPAKQVQLSYARWELGLPLPVEPEQLFPAINQIVVWSLGTLLGVAGVFVAVLVTASMIPVTFEPGPVDLLLSKPIARGWLFLAKFVGGCAFIAINAAYLICGIWLVLGLRFGLWNGRLLWAIPLYLFLFAIYYGVSALAGIIWRNAIVSVVLAIVFWGVCWSLGTAVSLIDQFALAPRRMTTIVPAGDTLLGVSRGDVFRWSDEEHDWKKIFVGRDAQLPFPIPQRLAGPLYDAAGKRIFAFSTMRPGFGPLSSSNRLLVGKHSDGWRRDEGLAMPSGAAALLAGRENEVLVASSQGIFRLEGDVAAKQADLNLLGFRLALPTKGARFANIGPKTQLRPLLSAAIDPQTGAIALFDGFKLVAYQRDDKGAYRQVGEQTFPTKQFGQVALAGGEVLLVLDDGRLHRYNDRLEPLDAVALPTDSLGESLAVSPDGRYLAIVFHNQTLWLYDVRELCGAPLSPVGQGDISAAAFDGPKLLVVDRLTRVTEYDVERSERLRQWQTDMPAVEKFYRYVLHPLYTIFPKPGQLNDTVTYVLTPKDATAGAVRLNDPENARRNLDVWGPVWSNLAFLVVVLGVACVYIYRKDF
jgi:hypothetical protein